ncbi:MAG: hypothetical protein RLO52_23540 [Sandaracinaceae bacterium]
MSHSRHARAFLLFAALGVAGSVAAQAPPLPFVGGELGQDAILARLTTRVPRSLEQVGTSSVTLKLDLGVGANAAFKPRTRSHPRGYLSEIAAYRVARALEMDNVPPAVGLRIPRRLMEARFESEHEEDWEPIRQEILWDAPGVARGAAIYWIPRMRSSELATFEGLSEVAPWLRVGEPMPPAESSQVARDLSTMLAFDYLIGNWDRFSGGNVSTDDEGRRLFVRDHNVAFQTPLTDHRYERIRGHLERTQRFSRRFVDAVRGLSEVRLRASLAEDPEAEIRDILDDAQIAGVMQRRRALLSYVGGLIALHGEAAVLTWD